MEHLNCDDHKSTFQGSSTHVWAPSNFNESDSNSAQPVHSFSDLYKLIPQPLDHFSLVTSHTSEFSNFQEKSPKFGLNPPKHNLIPENHPWEDHREKNNMACKKYREKQKERFKSKQDELSELQKINSELNKKLEAKKNEVRQLQSMMIRSMGFPVL